MLGDILDILDVKMVECTGDGNYSIFLENEIDNENIIDKGTHFFHDLERIFHSDYFIKIQNYILTFDTDEVKYVYPWMFDDWDYRRFMHTHFK